MKDLAILVDNKNDSTEAQDLLFSMGYKWRGLGEISKSYFYPRMNKYFIFMDKNEMDLQMAGYFAGSSRSYAESRFKEITLPELRDLVVLKRNSIDDATHEDKNDPEFKYRLIDNHWYVITEGNPVWRKDSIDLNEAPLFIKPIEKPMKEYLRKNSNGTYSYIGTVRPEHVSDFMVEIPEGAEILMGLNKRIIGFYKNDFGLTWIDGKGWIETKNEYSDWIKYPVLWQRTTHPEELPFIDDECYTNKSDGGFRLPKDEPCDMSKWVELRGESLNDQYAEIEKVRHNHYFKDVSDVNRIDVYEVLKRFNVTDPCLQHIIKKALCAGQRGHKDFKNDLQDILDTAKRAVEINK